MSTKVTARRAGHLVTFTRAIRGVERRVLTVDVWAPPESPHEMQQWFIGLLCDVDGVLYVYRRGS